MNSAVKITGETTHFVLHLPNQQSLVIILLNIITMIFLQVCAYFWYSTWASKYIISYILTVYNITHLYRNLGS